MYMSIIVIVEPQQVQFLCQIPAELCGDLRSSYLYWSTDVS